MTTSFKNADKKKQAEDAETQVVDQQALAAVEDDGANLPAERATVALALGKVSGTLDSRDLIIPRINIIQNVGQLSRDFKGNEGSIILNRETILCKADEPIKITVLSIKKTYEENLQFDQNGPRAVTFNTLEEVVDAGLTVEWINNQRPTAREVAEVLLLIEEPEGVEDLAFSYEFEGKRYALAVWTLRGTGYTHGAKPIFSKSQIELARDGLLAGEWELSATQKQINGNWVYVPVLRLVGRNSAEKVAFITEQLS